ncbi:protein TolQ [Magnetococcales bacterium HHB-1]
MNNPANTHSLWDLISQAGPVVQLVMLALLVSSLVSWGMIYDKWRRFRKIRKESAAFIAEFWSGISMPELYQMTQTQWRNNPTVTVFSTGFREWKKWEQVVGKPSDQRPDAGELTSNLRRAMLASLSREIDHLEQGLTFLATVGSTSPFIGLFGTVWGIMNAFRGLAGAKSTTLTMVAPGIAEALVATAMGLIAAIPAVIAFNKFSSDLRRVHQNADNFGADFLNILERQAVRILSRRS